MAGVFQLLEAITAASPGVFILDRLVVAGNGAATAANILGHERLFWLGFASLLMGVAFHIAWAFLMYELLKPVNRSLSSLAAFVILVGCAIQALTSLFYIAPLLILQGGNSLRADRLPHFQVDLPASNSGGAVGDQRFGLGDVSLPAGRIPSVHPLHRGRLRPRGSTAGVLAHRDGFERSTMEGAGQRSGHAHMKASVYSRHFCRRDVPPWFLPNYGLTFRNPEVREGLPTNRD